MTMIPKILSKTIFTFGKMFCAFLLVTLLAPLAYFARRAGQPMDRPEFRDLTYYRLLTERQEAYDRLAHSYQANHPTPASLSRVPASSCQTANLYLGERGQCKIRQPRRHHSLKIGMVSHGWRGI
jgi:hypothetical protein